jgi:glutathione S-transferase
MSEFVVHTIPGSPYARSVMATLEEKGAPWRLAPIPVGQLKQNPHLLRHPFGRMPALDHGDFALYETQAIVRYIDRVRPERPLTPADPKAAARMDQVMNINDWYLFQGCSTVISFQRIVGPALLGLSPDEAAIAAAMPGARNVFAELSRLLGEGPYFAGADLSLADMMIAPQLDFLVTTPEWRVLSAETPNLVSWLDRVVARPSLQATTWDRVKQMAAAYA